MQNRLWILALLLTGLYAYAPITPTAKMVAIAISIYVIIKWQTLNNYVSRECSPNIRDRVAWFALWPGLDAKPFFNTTNALSPPTAYEWLAAIAKTLAGAALLFGIAPPLINVNIILAGWIAMAGIVLLLHFGSFQLLALIWRRAGHDVQPIMNAPTTATSLSEFWNCRWNVAFRDFTHHNVFQPVARRWNARTATWTCFAFSGLVHELAISVPADSGFGLPMSYFLLQGLGVTAERNFVRRGIPVRSGISGWLYTFVFTVPAAYWLFHPSFVHQVILPVISN